MDLSIIIVNWNSVDYVKKCIASIYNYTQGIEFEIIVIDNASYDNCDDMIKRNYPEVQILQSHVNLGFAKANNLGYANSKGKSLLFLNPDTEIIGSALRIMYDNLWKIPSAGAIGCTLLNTDGTIQSSCIQPFPTLLNQLLDSEFLRQKMPKMKLWGMRPLYEAPPSPVQVDMTSGACTMVKRSVFKSIECFSTDYFMYAEDVDLCYKIKKAGYGVYYTNAAKVVHHGGGSSRQCEFNQFAAVATRESLEKFLRKSRGRLYSMLYRLSTGVAAICRVMLMALLIAFMPKTGSSASLKVSLVKWRKIFLWSLGFDVGIRNDPIKKTIV
jgi:GT2 family glycosyltransferase